VRLTELLDSFPKGRQLDSILKTHIQTATADRLADITTYVNSIPDSPLRSKLILQVCLKKGAKDASGFSGSLAMLGGQKIREQYMEAVLQNLPAGKQIDFIAPLAEQDKILAKRILSEPKP
jgi:hypothetical protein